MQQENNLKFSWSKVVIPILESRLKQMEESKKSLQKILRRKKQKMPEKTTRTILEVTKDRIFCVKKAIKILNEYAKKV